MKKPILHIVARHKRTLKQADMFFVSIAQASFFNPSFEDFREVGFEK